MQLTHKYVSPGFSILSPLLYIFSFFNLLHLNRVLFVWFFFKFCVFFFIQPENLCFLIDVFRSFIFSVIMGTVGFRPIIVVFVFHLSPLFYGYVPSFLPSFELFAFFSNPF